MKLRTIRNAIAIAVFPVVIVLSLSGCAGMMPEETIMSTPNKVFEFERTLEDGRTVLCLYVENGLGSNSTGGLSCDWPSASQ